MTQDPNQTNGTSRDPQTIRDGPEPGDMKVEESGLRIFVEDWLKDPLMV